MLLFLDSFDHYVDADWTKYTQKEANGASTNVIVGAFGRRGGRGLKLTATGGSSFISGRPRVVLPVTGNVAVWGVAFKSVGAFANLNANDQVGAVFKAGVQQFLINVDTSGRLVAKRGTGAVLGTSTFALTQNTFQYIECKATIHGTAGDVVVQVDGANVLTLTGVNTTNAGTAGWDEFAVPAIGGTLGEWWIDDLYVADGSGAAWNTVKGDVRVDAVMPNAPGTSSMWTRSAGTDQSATIDETQANGDTDYNSSAVVGDKDTLNFPNAPVAGATIYGLQVVAQIRKTDTGAAGHKPVVRLGGIDYVGTEKTVPSTYAFLCQAYDTRPSDGAAWTDTDFNAAEFGYQKSS